VPYSNLAIQGKLACPNKNKKWDTIRLINMMYTTRGLYHKTLRICNVNWKLTDNAVGNDVVINEFDRRMDLAELNSICYIIWLAPTHCLSKSFILNIITYNGVIPQPNYSYKTFSLQHIWKMLLAWHQISGKFHVSVQGQWNVAKLAFSQLANIQSFIPQWSYLWSVTFTGLNKQ